MQEKTPEIDRRFVSMGQRFHARFDTIEQELQDILGHFAEIHRRLERPEQGISHDPPGAPADRASAGR